MILCPNLTSIEGLSTCPDGNWYNDELHRDWLVVDETTEEGNALARRIRAAFPFFDLVLDDGKLVDIVEWPELEYSIDKTQLSTGEVATITTGPDTIVVVDEQEYQLVDGVLEYSNENPGVHTITLKKEKYKDAVIQIEVLR